MMGPEEEVEGADGLLWALGKGLGRVVGKLVSGLMVALKGGLTEDD